ncbi:hypothetical protein FGO68_gene10725 [Halteria grandinella]|uniref:RNI-like protein n=1 Tax=Halteria grandinella TaxID=5974 RepID=A0A8J8NP62_HALGN|nr:hypothetical protein FGO68_gene10725 [Halteria grandinella]
MITSGVVRDKRIKLSILGFQPSFLNLSQRSQQIHDDNESQSQRIDEETVQKEQNDQNQVSEESKDGSSGDQSEENSGCGLDDYSIKDIAKTLGLDSNQFEEVDSEENAIEQDQLNEKGQPELKAQGIQPRERSSHTKVRRNIFKTLHVGKESISISSSYPFDDNHLEELSQTLSPIIQAKSPLRLSSLILTDLRLTQEGFERLSNMVLSNDLLSFSLNTLVLYQPDLKNTRRLLLPALPHQLISLETLYLYGVSPLPLFSFLPQIPLTLKHLQLSLIPLSSTTHKTNHIHALAHFLSRHHLLSLTLHSCALYDDDSEIIADALAGSEQLQVINMSNNMLKDRGIKVWVEMRKQGEYPSLQKLVFCGNPLSEVAKKMIRDQDPLIQL